MVKNLSQAEGDTLGMLNKPCNFFYFILLKLSVTGSHSTLLANNLFGFCNNLNSYTLYIINKNNLDSDKYFKTLFVGTVSCGF